MTLVKLYSNTGNGDTWEIEALDKATLIQKIKEVDTKAIAKDIYTSLNSAYNRLEIQMSIKTGIVYVVPYTQGSYEFFNDFILLGKFDPAFDACEFFDGYFRDQAEDLAYTNNKSEWDSLTQCETDELVSEESLKLKEAADLEEIFADQQQDYLLDYEEDILERVENMYKVI